MGPGTTSFEAFTEDPASHAFSILVRYEDGPNYFPPLPNVAAEFELIKRIGQYAQKNGIHLKLWDEGLIINGIKYKAKFNTATNEIKQLANNYVIDSSLPLSAVATTEGSLIYIGASDLDRYLSLRKV